MKRREGGEEYRSFITPRRTRWSGHAAGMGKETNAYMILVGKVGGKRQVQNKEVGGWIITII
jgi:hypothetical protein